MAETDKEENIEFKWGKKRGLGGKKKDVQFYESFTYDDVEYTLYDSVYLYKEGEPEPYIGKIIKIWENSDKTKRVKILWFFRPCEILNFLSTNEACDNELFLASGEGVGLANVNPLEALVGKCNVICISKDSRNPQPLDEELQMAEFVFYRFFDVGQLKILDKIDDKIAGIDVKCIFNKLDRQKAVGILEFGLAKKEVSGKGMEGNEVMAPPSQKNSQSILGKANGQFVDTFISDNADSKSSMGQKPPSSVGVEGVRKSNDVLQTIFNAKSIPLVKVEEHEVSKASLIKQKSSHGAPYTSRAGLEQGKLAKSYDRLGKISSEKTTSRSTYDYEGGKLEVVGASDRQVEIESDIKSNWERNGLLENKQPKKAKLSDFRKKVNEKSGVSVQNRRLVYDDDNDNDNDNDNDVKASTPRVISSKDKFKLRQKDSCDVEEVPSKKLKLDNKPTKLIHGKLHKESSTNSPNVEQKLDSCAWEVTRRPYDDRRRWFKGFPWEERMKSAHDQGTLVLLQNLDPLLTSQEVEDIVWHGFQESCTAKMIQATAFSSPHSGQAFVVFKRREAAESVIRKLNEGCLLMSNGRPLVGSIGNPCFPEKKPIFYGHLVIDQLRMQMQREMKDAVSTSHCSQPNNIEYDMAMEWCLLQERAEYSWKRLYMRQGEELRKLTAKLMTK